MSTLIAVAGQSNALGYGSVGDTAAVYTPTASVQILVDTNADGVADTFQTMTPGTNTGTAANPSAFGAEVAIAKNWLADPANAGQTLYIVKGDGVVKGSTGLAQDAGQLDWSPASTGELWSTASTAVATAKSLTGLPLDAVFWMQGEQDAVDATKAANYATNEADFFAAIRATWGDTGTIIVQGRIADDAGLAYMSDVRTAQVTVDTADGLSFTVDTDALAMRGDLLHYSSVGLDGLGNLFFNAWMNGVRSTSGTSGNDTLDGANAGDFLNGGDGDDLITAWGGSDSINGGLGNDNVRGNMGDDTVSGNDGNDWVIGGQGNDWVHGNQGDDELYGDKGADTMIGGQGADKLFGGDGNDVVSGDKGNDTLTGGADADQFNFAAQSGTDVILDFSQADGDRFHMVDATTYSIAHVGADTVVTFAGGVDVLTIVGQSLDLGGVGWIV